MGRIYVDPTPSPESDKPEDNPVTSGRIYVGTTDAAGDPLPVLDTDGEVVTGTEGPGDNAGDDGGSKPAGEPAGNASREEWVEYARRQGASDEDLIDEDGNDLGRDALREKYGSQA